jgi:hypothetical protein
VDTTMLRTCYASGVSWPCSTSRPTSRDPFLVLSVVLAQGEKTYLRDPVIDGMQQDGSTLVRAGTAT